jgi:hypothetical protein
MKPQILYKYRDDSENTEKIFIDAKVWLAQPSSLNDPLECKTGQLPEEWKRKTIQRMEAAQIMGAIAPLPDFRPPETLFSLNKRHTKQWISKLKKLSHVRKLRAVRTLYANHGIHLSRPSETFQKMELQLSEVGIFSLSESCESELMWSHYSNSHTGIAIGFARNETNGLGDTKRTLKVTYKSEKQSFSTGFKHQVSITRRPGGGMESNAQIAFDDPVFQASVSTKTPPWSYEKEWRYVSEASGLHALPGEIIEVVFGARTPPERKEHYGKIMAKHGINAKIFEIRLNDTGLYRAEISV